jgi:hypothetical protein
MLKTWWGRLKRLASHKKKLFVAAQAILVVAIVAAIGYTLTHKNTKDSGAPAAPPAVYTQELVDSAGIYSITVPSDWTTQADIAKPPAATEFMAIAPISRIQDYRQLYDGKELVHTTVAVYDSGDSPKVWFDKQGFQAPAISKEMVLGGYNVYAATIITPDTTDSMYVYSHGGHIVHFVFHQKAKTYNPDKQYDYSSDVFAYDRIVTSLKFLK